MIETIIKKHLALELGVEVFLEKPSSKIESYVVLEKTSSGKRNHLPTAVFCVPKLREEPICCSGTERKSKNGSRKLNFAG